MDWVAGVAFLFLVKKFVDFLRYATNRDVNGVVTQLVAWTAGVGAVLIGAQTQWANDITVGSATLAHLSFWSQLFVGLTLASAASFAADTLSAVNTSVTGTVPTLIKKP